MSAIKRRGGRQVVAGCRAAEEGERPDRHRLRVASRQGKGEDKGVPGKDEGQQTPRPPARAGSAARQPSGRLAAGCSHPGAPTARAPGVRS